jgi:hypothetical protein
MSARLWSAALLLPPAMLPVGVAEGAGLRVAPAEAVALRCALPVPRALGVPAPEPLRCAL